MTSMLRRLVLPVVGLLALLVVTGCSGDDTVHSELHAAAHNEADVAFASQMVPHHQQALEMVELTQGRALSAPVAKLVAAIRDAQAPEIESMQGWLADWGETAPSHEMSGMGGMAGMDDHDSMPGMMSEAAMTRLAGATGQRFETLWLQMMIEHHEGAVTMARTEVADGAYAPAVRLASSIIESQSAEIATMKGLLKRS